MPVEAELDAARVLFATEGKDADTVRNFAGDLSVHGGDPKQITTTSSDMSAAFIRGIGDALPNAQLTFDRFHLAAKLSEAVDAVRRVEVATRLTEAASHRDCNLRSTCPQRGGGARGVESRNDYDEALRERQLLIVTIQDVSTTRGVAPHGRASAGRITWVRTSWCDCQGDRHAGILFTADDFASTRFLAEPAPSLELKFAARGLRRGIRAPWGERWRCSALAAVPKSARPAVRQIGGHFSWALTPTVAVCTNLDEGIEALLDLGPKRVREELALFFSAPNSGVPLLLRYAIEGDRDAGRVMLHGTKTAFTAMVQPYWADIRANHHSELAQHGRLLARRGIRAALTTVIPGASWCGDCLRIDNPQDHTVRLCGRGLVITPAAFWTGPPLVGELPDQPVLLAYPAPAVLSIRVDTESDSLAAILGTTRAAVLRLLSTEHTTGDVARQLGISAASASEHSAALRAARLISSRRDGKAVIHHATVLGLDLIKLNTR